MAARFIILGATGDLTGRYLMPAIAQLRGHRDLPLDESILGISQEAWDTDRFRRHISERLGRHADHLSAEVHRSVVSSLEYQQADVTDPDQLALLLKGHDGPVILYLALPPAVSGLVIRGLAELNLPEESRIVVEKPFGEDLKSARQWNDLLRKSFPERAIFRVDHFLGMQTVQNVLGLRFANRVFEYLWSRDHIERVEITWDETVTLEGRAGYYDRSGAARDMLQNHLLQLLCIVAMESPMSFDERDFRDRKVDVLRAVRQSSPDEVAACSVRGRYTAGQIGEREVPNYVNEPDVDPSRMTETFAQVTLWIDNWRWAGVPFVLRTGKALAADRHEMVIHFRPTPHLPFENAVPAANLLRLSLNPDRMELRVNINGPGDPFALETTHLDRELTPQDLPAYARLLLDVFRGNAVLSIRGEEAEESWRIVEPILAGWKEGLVPMRQYAAGSDGPLEP